MVYRSKWILFLSVSASVNWYVFVVTTVGQVCNMVWCCREHLTCIHICRLLGQNWYYSLQGACPRLCQGFSEMVSRPHCHHKASTDIAYTLHVGQHAGLVVDVGKKRHRPCVTSRRPTYMLQWPWPGHLLLARTVRPTDCREVPVPW